MPYPFGHRGSNGGFEVGKPVCGRRTDIINLVERAQAEDLLGQREQLLFRSNVNLVEHQPFLLGPVGQPFQYLFNLGAGARPAIDHHQDQVGVRSAFPRSRHHRPVEAAAGRKDAGCVDKDDLRVALDRDPHQPGPRGLRLGADNGDLLPDQCVDEGRFARIGRADNGNMAAALCHAFFSRNAFAAAVSAACLLFALADTGWKPLTVTVTSKRIACGGPSFAVTS